MEVPAIVCFSAIHLPTVFTREEVGGGVIFGSQALSNWWARQGSNLDQPVMSLWIIEGNTSTITALLVLTSSERAAGEQQALSALEHLRNGLRGVGFHPREDVGIRLRGECGGGMTQPLLDDLHGHPSLQEIGTMSMAEVVNGAMIRKAKPLTERL